MRSSPKLRPALWDGAVILAVGLLAAVCAWSVWHGGDRDGPLRAVVQADGRVVEEIALEALDGPQERIVSANGYTLRLELTRNGARILEADCPTQDCVHTGQVTRGGESIVCLPARIIVQLEGGTADGSAVDLVIG